MNDVMKYKGYFGSVHFDADEPIFYGKLEFVKALVSYEANDAPGIKQAFEEAVDDYLETCERSGVMPETPFKGSFNVRTGHKLHEQIALAAEQESLSINRFICLVLQKACQQRLRRRGE
jgi:predicted HicB family RNase H-like nuclease